MQKLGTVLHISSQSNIVVKSYLAPKLGKKSIVMDKNQKKIGYIYDVIGPVKSPYLLIKPFTKLQDNSELIGKSLYMKNKNKKMRDK